MTLLPGREHVGLGKGCPHGNHGRRLKGQPTSPPPGQTRAGPTTPRRWERTAQHQPGRRARRPSAAWRRRSQVGRGPRVIRPAQEVAGAAHTPRALGRLPAAPTKAQVRVALRARGRWAQAHDAHEAGAAGGRRGRLQPGPSLAEAPQRRAPGAAPARRAHLPHLPPPPPAPAPPTGPLTSAWPGPASRRRGPRPALLHALSPPSAPPAAPGQLPPPPAPSRRRPLRGHNGAAAPLMHMHDAARQPRLQARAVEPRAGVVRARGGRGPAQAEAAGPGRPGAGRQRGRRGITTRALRPLHTFPNAASAEPPALPAR